MVVGELSGSVGQEMLEMPSVQRWPRKERSQDQQESQIWLINRPRRLITRRRDNRGADLAKRAPKEE